MRRIAANYIFPVSGKPIRNGILEVEDDGTVRKLYDFGGEMVELAHTEFLNGVLVPGFINMHTHLELAHLSQINPPGKGLAHFIKFIISQRDNHVSQTELRKADNYMYRNGIVAACDISNTTRTIEIKQQSKIHYHTFTEVSGLIPEVAQKRLSHIRAILSAFRDAGLAASIAPHAPYSISEELWKSLAPIFEKGEITTIHNQESEEENLMFEQGQSALTEAFNDLGIMDRHWQKKGKRSLPYILQWLNGARLLLVHNTFTNQSDLEYVKARTKQPTGFVLCPTSNKQIENQLPNTDAIRQMSSPIMLGTDSSASGHSLSLLPEMYVLQEEKKIPFSELVKYATANAAKFMGWEKLGAFEPGMKPGINLIKSFNFKSMGLNEHSSIKRIL
jgi:cytosine/adenosine deaminase-related metal-dependent hydrolase